MLSQMFGRELVLQGSHMDIKSLAVVVPIYNVEDYLLECLESIRQQTIFPNLEIILIDDGSTDSSGEIAESFSSLYPNCIYHRKINGGLGAARNTGMDLANSEFITFIDSDDIVPPRAFELLLSPFRNDRINVTVGRMKTFPIETKLSWERALSQGSRRWAGISQMPDLIHSASACNKVFRVSKIRALGMRFEEGVHFEDAFFVIPLLVTSDVIEVIDEPVYMYRKRVNGGSIMDSLFTKRKNYWDYISLLEHLRKFSKSLPDDHIQYIDDFIVRGFQGFLLRAESVLNVQELPEFYSRAYEVFKTVSPEVFHRSTHNAKHRIPYALLLDMGHRSSFRKPKLSHRISVDDGAPVLSSFRSEVAIKLVKTKSFTNAIESIQLVGSNFVFEGRVSARGLPFDEKPDVSLSLHIGSVAFAAEWVRRYDREKSDGLWTGFYAVVPVHRWPVGDFYPKIRFASGNSVVAQRLLKSNALFRNLSLNNFMEHNISLIISDKNQVLFSRVNSKIEVAKKSKVVEFAKAYKQWTVKVPFAGLRVIRALTAPFVQRESWLIGERHDIAQDNGAALFKYMSENEISIQQATGRQPKIRYVIDKSSPKYHDMRKLGSIVAHGSWRHIFHLLHAKVLISAFDVDSYLIPRKWIKSEFVEYLLPYLGCRRVFLQHGVTFRNVAPGLHRLVQGYDMVITSSKNEQAYFANKLGYGRRAVLTGMPRFASLTKIESRADSRKILFAPTWRAGLVMPSYKQFEGDRFDASFAKTLYCRSIVEFLQDEELKRFLAVHDCELLFLPHYEVAEFFTERFRGTERVSVLNQNEIAFQEKLRQADLFITDYSSTFFDVALMGTPVVHWMFDSDNYVDNQELSLFDLWTDGFGPVVSSHQDVIRELSEIASNEFVRSEKYEQRVEKYFEGIPLDSAKATMEAIVDL